MPGRITSVFARLKLPLIGGATVFSLLALTVAGASPAGIPNLAEVAGLMNAHGGAVSNAVHDARDTLEDGERAGPAVSEAACTAAHDRSTLPEGAQNAPGQAGLEPKDCTHPANAEEPADEEDEADEGDVDVVEADQEGEEPVNHGQSVRQAVQDARDGLEEGDKVGPAVSEAACTAAHDRTTLPEGAQNAPGQEGREPRDCTHPSNAGEQEPEEAEAASEGSEKPGKGTAPGQLKKPQ